MKRLNAWVLVCLIFSASCATNRTSVESDVWRKIEFDLAQLDAAGLRGPPDGKVSLSYEFCIPDTAACRAEVRAIDSKIQFMPGSRGRIGAGSGQCLCIGSTHGNDYLRVLRGLARLSYVMRIIECHFE